MRRRKATVELFEEIRREYEFGIGTIQGVARKLGVHRRLVREALNGAGYPRVRIVASSGFGVDKCRVMSDAKAPIDVVGTGSFIPDAWHETYATADIVAYGDEPLVKVGREFLLRKNGERRR